MKKKKKHVIIHDAFSVWLTLISLFKSPHRIIFKLFYFLFVLFTFKTTLKCIWFEWTRALKCTPYTHHSWYRKPKNLLFSHKNEKTKKKFFNHRFIVRLMKTWLSATMSLENKNKHWSLAQNKQIYVLVISKYL